MWIKYLIQNNTILIAEVLFLQPLEKSRKEICGLTPKAVLIWVLVVYLKYGYFNQD